MENPKTPLKDDEDLLDDLFSDLKRKKKCPSKESKKSSKPPSMNDDMGFTKEGYDKKIKYTSEGYRIYSPDELKLGQGGGTEKCPFDCDCCF